MSLLTRKRFQFAGALVLAALLPWAARGPLLPGELFEAASVNTLIGNLVAIVIAFWMRLSIETYPGIRRSYVIFPAALTGHGLVVVYFVLTRFPYDRVGLLAGFLLHVVWLYLLYVYAERNIRRRIAVVPFGAVEQLTEIDSIDWLTLSRPRLHDARGCPCDRRRFRRRPARRVGSLPCRRRARREDRLPGQAAGRIADRAGRARASVGKQLRLAASGARLFLFEGRSVDFAVRCADPAAGAAGDGRGRASPSALDSRGPVLFRQKRVGHAGKRITVYKFRTMRPVDIEDERRAAMTGDDDERITRVGRTLRNLRLDELPQIINILKWQMSWIGPRPEAEVLSVWYTSELPFYRYRHVVKPGISGWAQVNQGHVAEVEEVNRKLQYDFYYIKYFSPWLDLLILFRTIKTMLTGCGSALVSCPPIPCSSR